ncbi:MAG: glutamyl-tRNA amidotransferase [Actinomycetia bacterium]|nr:glutamyl-tRNA amidotransferase [Actinomycetes bacterium]
MRRSRLLLAAITPLAASVLALTSTAAMAKPEHPKSFTLEETTVAKIHAAFANGSLSCETLIGGYLNRIKAYEHAGPAINSLITVAPVAMAQARALDVTYRRARGHVGALHCIPVILKDNVETKDMQTTGGSKALAGSVPPQDAYITARLRESGALILGKGNMDEWAHGGKAGYSSINGQTLNPYDLSRSPAGSSGGPAAAVAANFAALSIGTDTLGSLRGPINAESLVGVKPTRGLVSGTGIIPFALTFDVAGPMTRTVTDSARLLNVIAGVDEQDPRTLAATGKIPEDYTRYLRTNALKGVRVGVLRTYVTGSNTPVIDQSLKDLEALGATIVDGIQAPASLQALQGQYYTFISETEFKNQLGDYLRTRRPGAPVQSHADVLAASEAPGFGMAPVVLARLKSEATRGSLTDADYLTAVKSGPAAMRAEIDKLLKDNNVDVLVHAGSSGSAMASLSGYPSVLVPAGVDASGVSVSMAFLGKAFTEPQMLGYAYAYEQATHHRQVPVNTPPLAPLSSGKTE